MVKTNIELIKWAEEITKLNADIERLDQEKTEAENKLKQKLESMQARVPVKKNETAKPKGPFEDKLKNILDKQEENIRKHKSIKSSKKNATEMTVEAVKELIDKGESYKEISRILDVDYHKLYYFIGKHELHTNSQDKKTAKAIAKVKSKDDTGEIP